MIILRFLLDSSSAQIRHSRCCRCHNNSLHRPETISLRGCSFTNTWDVHNMWLLPQSATSAETSRSDLPGIFSNVRFSWYFSNARFSWYIQQCQISWYFSNVKKCFELIDKPGKGTMRAWAVWAMMNKKRTRQVDSMSACVELMRGTVDSIVLWNAIRLSPVKQSNSFHSKQRCELCKRRVWQHCVLPSPPSRLCLSLLTFDVGVVVGMGAVNERGLGF